jgi:hypothetical protein
MESVLLSFISLALIIISTVTMTMNTVNSAASLSESWKTMQEKSHNLQKTEIVSIPPQSYSGAIIEITVRNEGQVNLSDFAHWDVIVEDPESGARYLTYSPDYPPANNQWANQGIYMSEIVPEAFNSGVLDPGEQLKMALNPDPPMTAGQPIKITIATADGITTQCFITGL